MSVGFERNFPVDRIIKFHPQFCKLFCIVICHDKAHTQTFAYYLLSIHRRIEGHWLLFVVCFKN